MEGLPPASLYARNAWSTYKERRRVAEVCWRRTETGARVSSYGRFHSTTRRRDGRVRQIIRAAKRVARPSFYRLVLIVLMTPTFEFQTVGSCN